MDEKINYCNNCCSIGVEIDETKGIGKCNVCGARTILPKEIKNSEIAILLTIAYNNLMYLNFGKAIETYEAVLKKDSDNLTAYEGLILAKHGITYVSDSTGKRVPTCHCPNFKSIFEDEDYIKYYNLCNDDQKEILQSRAKEIDDLMNSIQNKFYNVPC